MPIVPRTLTKAAMPFTRLSCAIGAQLSRVGVSESESKGGPPAIFAVSVIRSADKRSKIKAAQYTGNARHCLERHGAHLGNGRVLRYGFSV
jgi:hypothetical protein